MPLGSAASARRCEAACARGRPAGTVRIRRSAHPDRTRGFGRVARSYGLAKSFYGGAARRMTALFSADRLLELVEKVFRTHSLFEHSRIGLLSTSRPTF